VRHPRQRQVHASLHPGGGRPGPRLGCGHRLHEPTLRPGDSALDAQGVRVRAGGATVVCLVPARTDTDWWHRYAIRGEIRFLKGRLKFGDAPHAAPFRARWWSFVSRSCANGTNPTAALGRTAGLLRCRQRARRLRRLHNRALLCGRGAALSPPVRRAGIGLRGSVVLPPDNHASRSKARGGCPAAGTTTVTRSSTPPPMPWP